MKQQGGLTTAFSAYLDVLRFVAAVAVLLDHLTSYPFSDNTRGAREGLALVGSYGAAAVTIFFVLSGYVIAYVTSERERTGRQYTTARLSRLYSVVIPALLITIALDTLGQHINPDFYSIRKVLWKPPSFEGYFSSLLFLNEYQVFDFGGIAPGSNAPFWSLSFEATYYLLAGLLLFARRRFAIPACLLILALAGRTIVAMAPLWALGFWLYHARHALAAKMRAPGLVAVVSAAAILVAPFVLNEPGWSFFGVSFPWGRGPFARDLRLDYLVAAAFAAHLVAAQRIASAAHRFPGRWEGTVRYLGTLTFPMYAAHYPVLCFLAAISPWNRESPASVAFVTLGVLAVIALLTPACEWLKRAFRGLARRPVLATE